jgi:hypothetical protein
MASGAVGEERADARRPERAPALFTRTVVFLRESRVARRASTPLTD